MAAAPARSLLQQKLSIAHSFLQNTHPAAPYRIFHGLHVDICSTVVIHGVQEDNLFHYALLQRLQRNLCSSIWTTSSPSFTSVCRAIFSIFFSIFSLTAACYTFWNMLSQRCHQYHWHFQCQPAAGTSWNCLEQAVSHTRHSLNSSCRGLPPHPTNFAK